MSWTFFGVLGIVLMLLAAAMAAVSLIERPRRRLIQATPARPIAQTPGGAVVKIAGRVVPSEQGTVVGPFSGQHGVHLHTSVGSRSQNSFGLFDEVQQREFWIDDGSGEYARVRPAGARVEIDSVPVVSTDPLHPPSEAVEAFMRHHGLELRSPVGTARSLSFREALLAVGDPVFAIGPAMRQPSGLAGPVLVLCAHPGQDGELILTNQSEAELLSRLRANLLAGKILALIGGVFLAVAVIGWLASG